MPKITQRELARRLGLSRSSVAAALNPASPIKLNEETRRQILDAAKEWNYRPDRYARIMRGGRSGLIGLLHFGGLLQVAAERSHYAACAVREAGYEVVPVDLSWSVKSLLSACQSLVDARVEGVIVAGLNDPHAVADLKVLKDNRIPVVLLSGNPLSWAPHFRGDARRAYFDLTEHLLKLGHRNLALMPQISSDGAGVYLWAAEERVRGFKEALIKYGGKLGHELPAFGRKPVGIVSPVPTPKTLFNPFEPGLFGMRKLLSGMVRPTAVLCGNDELACGALEACRQAGITVPRAMAITGYDDTALGNFCGVSLTSVRQPSKEMAERALTVLLDLIKTGKARATHKVELFPCELVIRESSGSGILQGTPAEKLDLVGKR